MSKIDDLKAFGANVDEGLKRCVNNEEFYMRMVNKAADDASFDDLEKAVNSKDLGQAFEIAHALKGVLANLALTPICDPVSDIVEKLRNKTDADYGSYLEIIRTKREELINILK